jgi:hypothetical protein
MLEAVPRRWGSSNYIVLQDGLQLANIKCRGIIHEKGEIVLENRTYTVRRDGLKGPFLFEVDGTLLAQATILTFKGRIEVEYEGQRYILRRQSIWKSTFLLERDGEILGTVRPKGWWSGKAVIEIPGFPLPIVLFFFWLVMAMWAREAAAVAAAGAVASAPIPH